MRVVVGTDLPEVVSEKRVAVESEEMPNEELTKLTELCEEGKRRRSLLHTFMPNHRQFFMKHNAANLLRRHDPYDYVIPRIKRWPLHREPSS